MTTMKRKINLNSPLGQLLLEKHDLKRACWEMENRLKSDWHHASEYASYGIDRHPWLSLGWQMARPWLLRRLCSSLLSIFRSSRR